MDSDNLLLLLSPLFLNLLLKRGGFKLPPDDDSGAYLYDICFHGTTLQEIQKKWFLLLLFPKVFLAFLLHFFPKTSPLLLYRISSLLIHLALNLMLMLILLKLGVSPEATACGGVLYALLSSSPFIQWWNIYREHLYLLFIGIAFYILLGVESAPLSLIIAGILLGISVYLKPVCTVYPPLFILHSFFMATATESGLLFVGTLFGYLLLKGVFALMVGEEYDRYKRNMKHSFGAYQVLHSFRLSGEGRIGDMQEWCIQSLPLLGGLLLFAVGSSSAVQPLFLLHGFALLTFLVWYLQGSVGRYSYLPLVFCASLYAAIGWDQGKYAGIPEWGILLFFVLLSLPLCRRAFPLWRGEDIKNYAGIFEKKDQYAYLPALGRYLKKRIPENERLFVWGSYPQVYLLSEREGIEESCLYLFNHAYDEKLLWVYNNIMHGLITYRPLYIVQTHHNLDIKELEKQSGLKYTLETVWCNLFALYRLSDDERTMHKQECYSSGWSDKRKKEAMNRLCSGGAFYCGILPRYEDEKAYQKGVIEAERGLKLFPDDSSQLRYLIRLYAAMGKYKQALRHCLAITEKRGSSLERASHQLLQAELYQAEQELSAATEACHKAVDLLRYPLFPLLKKREALRLLFDAYYRLFILKKEQGDDSEAASYLVLAEEIASNRLVSSPSLFLNLGYCYEAVNRKEKIRPLIEKLRSLDIPSTEQDASLFAYGTLCRIDHQLKQATEALGKLYDKNRHYRRLAHEYALALQGAGRADEAIAVLHDALLAETSVERRGELHLQAGIIERQQGKLQKACEHFRNAKKEASLSNQSLKNRLAYQYGSALKALGKYDEAKLEFKALVDDTSIVGVLRANASFHLGDIALKEEKFDEAEKWLQQAIESNQHHQRAKELLASLKERRR